MGINQIASLAGQFIGLVVGGILAAINWRLVFLISVPFSVGGTIWAYVALRETATIRKHQKLDIPGNLLFAFGLTALLVGMTYGLQPYRNSDMGWGNPFVLACLVGGVLALIAFVFRRAAGLPAHVPPGAVQDPYVRRRECRRFPGGAGARWAEFYADHLAAGHLAARCTAIRLPIPRCGRASTCCP